MSLEEQLKEQVSKLTSKTRKQRQEIGRLTADLQGTKDNLADVIQQRNTLQARLREVLEEQAIQQKDNDRG